jgi:nucleoid-associated protein YgaU
MSILDRILGRKKKEEETPKPAQVAEDVAKARREQLAREKAEAEAARLRSQLAEKERLEALAKQKQQVGQTTGTISGAYTGAIPGVAPVVSATGAIPGTVAAQAKAEPKYYVVKDGDYLSKIAKEIYGDAKRWPEIYEANKALIGDNPNIIHAGQKLLIP